MFSPLPFASKRLPWLVCSILQYGTARWTLPHYFEYDIVNGPASTSVEWIRVYVPGPWQPVAESTLGPAPEDTTTYREWHKFYHFDVYWPVTARAAPIWALFPSRSHMRPFIHGSIVTGSPEDINGSVIRAPTLHVQFSLRDHQASCTLDCPLRRHPRTRMVADVRPRLSRIFNSI